MSSDPERERFERLVRAGAGSHGVVWFARDRESGEHVALKVLHEAVGPRVARFEREARILAALRHPRIARYIAHGVTGTGEPYLAMEWLTGETVAERLRREPLTLAEAVEITRGAAEGLGAAHAAGVVHRDVKTSNLFLADKRPADVRVVDFGVARNQGSLTVTLTATDALVGTLSTMAPEQLFGAREVGPAADVYSLGCVLYRCVTGHDAQPAGSVRQLVASVLSDDPVPMSEHVGGVPAALDALVRAMLAKSPENRPAHGAEVVAALDAIDLGAGADATLTPRRAMSLEERRPVCVVAVRGAPLDAIERAAARERARWMPLGDDGGIAWWRRPHAELRRAVRFAESLPEMARAEIAMGMSVERSSGLVGEAVAHAVAELAREGPPRIGLAAEVRALLEPTHETLYGRDRELARIDALRETVVEDDARALLLVVGEPGVGKSALLAHVTGVEAWDDVDEGTDRIDAARAWLAEPGAGLLVVAARDPSPAWRALAGAELRLRPLSASAAAAWAGETNAAVGVGLPAALALLRAGHHSVILSERAPYWEHDDAARRALRAGSLLEEPFDDATLEAMIGEPPRLPDLVRDGRFGDPLSRRVARAVTTRTDRRLGHRLAATHLELHGGAARAIADHWAEAGEAARALPWYGRAARRALEREAFEDAEALAVRALRLSPPPAARGELLAVQGAAAARRGRSRAAIASLEEAVELLVAGTARWYDAIAGLASARAELGAPVGSLRALAEQARPARGAEDALQRCLRTTDTRDSDGPEDPSAG